MKKVFLECVSFCKKTIVASVIVELTQTVVTIAAASAVGNFSDALFNQNAEYAMKNVGFILLYMAANILLVPVVSFWGDVVCIKGSIRYSVHMFSRLVNMKYEKATSIPAGEVKARLESDVIMYRNSVILVLARLIIIPLSITFLLILMGRISVIYTIIACVLSLVVLVTPLLTRNLTAVYEDEIRQYEASTSTLLHELFIFAPYVKLFHIGKKMIENYSSMFRCHFKNTQAKSITLSEVAQNLTVLTNLLATSGILITGALLNAKNLISTGSIITMTGYYAALLSVMEGLGFIVSKLKQLGDLGKRLDIFYLNEEKKSLKQLRDIFPIRARNVSYQKEDNYFLRGTSFDIFSGQKVAIVGKNGTGKTTLLNILTGLYGSYEGRICYGESELSELSTKTLTQCYSFVSQQPVVFCDTVRENVRFGNSECTEEQIEDIINELGLLHIQDHVIDPNGSNLSGGELQRISMARAVLKKRPLMIMDEPSNNLDHDCLEWVNHYIRTNNQTLLFVTHDAAMAEMADVVIELKA